MCDLPPSRPRALSEPGFGLGRTVHIVGRWHGLSAAGRVATLIVGILMTWVVLLPALASLAIELEPASGPPGSEVVGRTIGSGAFPRTLAERRFSLSVLDADTSIEGAEPEAFIPIGNLRVTPEGDGVTEFVIPEIPVGSYTPFDARPAHHSQPDDDSCRWGSSSLRNQRSWTRTSRRRDDRGQ